MNSLYSVEQDKNRWDYGGGVGIISKQTMGSDYDAVQDQNIESNKEQIQETKQSLRQNNARDDAQQTQINSNTEAIERNESRDDSQQLQIDETIERLNQNISEDEKQQEEIDANKTEISRLDGEMPTLSIEGTTIVIGQRKDN